MDRGALQATVHGVTRVGHDFVSKHSEHVVTMRAEEFCLVQCRVRDVFSFSWS